MKPGFYPLIVTSRSLAGDHVLKLSADNLKQPTLSHDVAETVVMISARWLWARIDGASLPSPTADWNGGGPSGILYSVSSVAVGVGIKGQAGDAIHTFGAIVKN